MAASPPGPRTGAEPVRPAGTLSISEPPRPSRRRWVWVAVCAVVAVIAMLGVVTAVNSVSDRDAVVAIARDVPAGSQITAKDLTVAEVAEDPALTPVPASQRTEVVGQYATAELRKGSLLTQQHTSATNEITKGRQLVGLELQRGQLPSRALKPGDRASMVAAPDGGGSGGDDTGGADEEPVPGTVAAVSKPDASGSVVVNVAVSSAHGPDLAARAAQGDVALVLESRS